MVKTRSSCSKSAVQPSVKASKQSCQNSEGRRRSSRLEQKARAQEVIAEDQEEENAESGDKEAVSERTLEAAETATAVKDKRIKFVRIEKGPIDFRCCDPICCLSRSANERGYSYQSCAGIVLDDGGNEVLVVPEMMCSVSQITHTHYEVVKGSNVQLLIGSNEIRTSPTTALFIDIDAIRAFERRHRVDHKFADSDGGLGHSETPFAKKRNSQARPGHQDTQHNPAE
ncbi:hypothetical protein JCM3765_005416 [Sporobolomyces pararoseus]